MALDKWWVHIFILLIFLWVLSILKILMFSLALTVILVFDWWKLLVCNLFDQETDTYFMWKLAAAETNLPPLITYCLSDFSFLTAKSHVFREMTLQNFVFALALTSVLVLPHIHISEILKSLLNFHQDSRIAFALVLLHIW